MKHAFQPFAFLLLSLLAAALQADALHAADWSVPMAGNAFRSAPAPGGQGFQRNGTIAWGDPESNSMRV
jgi:hypothetical protein